MMWSRSSVDRCRLHALLLSGVLLSSAMAQPAAELLTRMRRTYQEEASIYLKRNTVLRFERSAEGTVAIRESVEEELYLKDHGGSAKEREVYYSGLMELVDLEAYTLSFQGKGYKRMNVDRIDHKDRRDEEVFHDEIKTASFVMPSITAGSIAHVAHTVKYQEGRLVTGHFFGSYIPTEESSLTVITDPGIEVEVRTFHLSDSALVRTDRLERGKRVQRLTMQRVPAVAYEPNAPSWKHHAPHAQLVVTVPEAAPAASAIDRLYHWYMELADSTTSRIHPDVRALSDSITAGVRDPIDRATRLFQWVQEHIRYVAFEDGMNGFIPAAPEEVLRVRYGDCKGMSGLLSTLLRASGASAHMTWIGTRDLPYAYAEMPGPAATNHMIVALDLADTTLFLDATSRTCGFGVPSGFIQGKEAMIASDASSARIVKVPIMDPSFSTITDSVHARMDGTALVGRGSARFTGYDRYRMVEYLQNTPPQRHSDLVRAVLMKGSNAFLVDSFGIRGLEDRSSPLIIDYHFRIPSIISSHGNKMFVPPHLSDPWSFLRSTKSRTLPIELEHQTTRRYVMLLEVPEGMRCTSLPVDWSYDKGPLRCSLTSSTQGSSIRSGSTFTLGALTLPGNGEELRGSNSELPKALARTLVLERP